MLEGFFQEGGALHGFAKVSRPLAVTMVVAIPALGAMTVGIVSGFNPSAGAAMAANSTAFLKGIPVEIVALIGTLGTGYIAAKSWETRSPAPPEGQLPPETPVEEEAAASPARIDAGDYGRPDPSMSESGLDGFDYDRSTTDEFDENAAPIRLFRPAIEDVDLAVETTTFKHGLAAAMRPRSPILGDLKSSNEEDPTETPELQL